MTVNLVALETVGEWLGGWALVVGVPWLIDRTARRSRMRRLFRAKARAAADRNAGIEASFAAGRDQLLAAVRNPEALRVTGGES